MIQAIKKLFTKDKSLELKMLEIIQQQHDFISKNINERVVYVDKDSGYTNAYRFDEKEEKQDDEDEEFEEPHDITPEELEEHFNKMQEEGNK